MQLVKKTQKDWECSQCLNKIKAGSVMFRDYIHRWSTLIYCKDCAKSYIEDKLKLWENGLKEHKKSNKPMSAYMLFKDNIEMCKKALDKISKI